jgi:hypothetical protein
MYVYLVAACLTKDRRTLHPLKYFVKMLRCRRIRLSLFLGRFSFLVEIVNRNIITAMPIEPCTRARKSRQLVTKTKFDYSESEEFSRQLDTAGSCLI